MRTSFRGTKRTIVRKVPSPATRVTHPAPARCRARQATVASTLIRNTVGKAAVVIRDTLGKGTVYYSNFDAMKN